MYETAYTWDETSHDFSSLVVFFEGMNGRAVWFVFARRNLIMFGSGFEQANLRVLGGGGNRGIDMSHFRASRRVDVMYCYFSLS